MAEANPRYILRNHMAQKAIELAERDDFSEVERLFQLFLPGEDAPQRTWSGKAIWRHCRAISRSGGQLFILKQQTVDKF